MSNRKRIIGTSNDVQNLKLGYSNSFVNNTYDFQILNTQSRIKATYSPELAVKFNTNDLSGLHILGYLEKNQTDLIHAHNCIFNVYTIDLSNNWQEILIHTENGVAQTDGRFIADISQLNLGSVYPDGEQTLSIEMTIQRFKKTYRKKIYANHLGVYESITRLRKEVQWLDLTKLDE